MRPDPFVGLPDAPVVLVLANPGYTNEQRAASIAGCAHGDDWHVQSSALRLCYAANYRHEAQPFPVFFLDPHLATSPGGVYYRRNLLPRLRQRFDDERLAHALTLIEFYPYYSQSFKWSKKFTVPSQSYSHELIRRAIERRATIVVMRCRALIEESIPELSKIDYVTSKNARCAMLSRANLVSKRTGLHDGFDRIVATIEKMT